MKGFPTDVVRSRISLLDYMKKEIVYRIIFGKYKIEEDDLVKEIEYRVVMIVRHFEIMDGSRASWGNSFIQIHKWTWKILQLDIHTALPSNYPFNVLPGILKICVHVL